MERYSVGNSCAVESLKNEIFELVVQLERVEVSVFRHGHGKAYCGISCECAELKYAPGSAGLHDYAEQLALDRSGKHPGMVGPDMGLFLHPVQSLTLSTRMLLNIFINLLHYI